MALAKAIVAVAAVAALMQLTVAVDHQVGGTAGWQESVDYKKWAAQQKFVQGDTILFKYSTSHDVAEVNKEGYEACSASSSLGSYTTGSTTIKLDSPGKRYFICAVPGHCAAGMRLEVDVPTAAVTAPTKSKPKHKSGAPGMAPALAPEAATPAVPSTEGLPTVASPTGAQAPTSGAAGIGMFSAKAGMGLALGTVLVLAL